MKTAAFVAAALVALSSAVASAKQVRLNITRKGTVPVPCAEEKLGTCHNRWHPDIKSAASANPGDTVTFETRDAFDNPFNRASTRATVAGANLNLIHPLTGPLFVNGGKRGDVLAVTMVDVVPGPDMFGYTVAVPGFGFLRDVFTNPFIVHWELGKVGTAHHARFATSADLPGVRLPLHGFAGTIGVELGSPEVEIALAREDALLQAKGFVLPPEPHDAVPADLCGVGGRVWDRCLRTIPPRENGGNTDIKQMVKGTTLLFPCFVDGCMLSIGDVHWAQGDGEVSGTAIEMNAIVTVKVEVRKGLASGIGGWPMFQSNRPGVLRELEPDNFIATIGVPVKTPGHVIAEESWLEAKFKPPLADLANQSEDVTLAARDALMKMIDFLHTHHGLTPEQAYILCSVACDLKISNLVDVPNFVVSDFLHLYVLDRSDDDD
jgi:formamidase